MRRTAVIFSILLIAISIFSCKKTKESVNEATTFNIDYSSQVDVPTSGTVAATVPIEIYSPEVPTTSQAKMASEQTTQDLIEDIRLTKFTLTALNGNLDFLKSITVFIKAPGLSDVQVASKSNIPAGATSIALDLTNNDIKQHIFKEKIQFKIQATILSGQNADQKIKIDETVTLRGKRL
jgi:hypothetical protein